MFRSLPHLTVCPGVAPENVIQAVHGCYRGYVIQPPEDAQGTTDGRVVPIPSDNHADSHAPLQLGSRIIALPAVLP